MYSLLLLKLVCKIILVAIEPKSLVKHLYTVVFWQLSRMQHTLIACTLLVIFGL